VALIIINPSITEATSWIKMRTTGPARTIRLLTKGGSLPNRVSSRNEVSSKTETDPSSEASRLPPDGRGPAGSVVTSDSARSASSSQRNVSLFLKNAIVELISKSRNRSDIEGHSPETPFPFSTPFTCRLEEDSRRERKIAKPVSARFPRWKRILDLVCIFLTLPFWLPLTILVMLWIKVASPGPIFYRQERIGHGRNRFMMFKFRSMKVNVETQTHEYHLERLIQADGPMTKLDVSGDPRLIPGGLIFRATGLDELPQIFNVLRGEMSLVGPRPCTRHEFARYQTWQQERVDAPPGLTGYWQVNGKNKTTFSEMVAMDIFYANNMSIWLDLRILLKTIPAIASQIIEARSLRGREGGKTTFRATAPIADNFAGPAAKV
jgi:lipopolysaccharide/colanic/teichoic acid biosynthesis glycosyltransferase